MSNSAFTKSSIATPVPADLGGTGVANNIASTLTISGNFGTTLTVSEATGVTLPASGTLITLAGSETLTNKSIDGDNNTITNLALAAEVTGALANLTDVGVTTPTDKNALMADGDSWESRALVEADISDLGSYVTGAGAITAVEGEATLVFSGSISLGAHAFDDIDISAEFTDTDDHIMSSKAIKTKIENYGYSVEAGTVTSVAALTIGTTGTDLSSSVATGTTTPVITIQVPTASAANRGALSSANWTTFNNKASSGANSDITSITGLTTNLTVAQGGTGASTLAGAGIMELSGGTMTGDIQLGETDIKLDAVLSGDEKWSGITEAGTAGATLVVGKVCYQASTEKWLPVDGILDGTDVGFSKKLGMCVLAASADTDPTEMLLIGKIRSALLPTLAEGEAVYLSDTAGTLIVAQPSTTNFAIRKVGYGVTEEDLFFNPSNDYIVHT